VQLIDACLNNLTKKTTQTSPNDDNLIIFLKNEEYKNYLQIMCIKQFALRMEKEQNENKQRKLMLLVTNMGSDVSKYVDIVSRHTMLKIGLHFILLDKLKRRLCAIYRLGSIPNFEV
jgi:hypothetical protein